MVWQHPDYLRAFVFERVLESFHAGSRNHARPLYYYVPVLLGAILPWTAYLPAALRAGARAAFVDRDVAARFLLLWLGGTFTVFSLATAKLATYLLPCLPAAALLVARLWHEALLREAPSRALAIAKLVMVALIAVAAGLRPPARWLAGDMTLAEVRLLGSIVLAGQAVVAALLLTSRLRAALAGEVATLAALLLAFTLSTAPKLESHRSSKELAARLDHWLEPGAPIPVFGRVVGVVDAALFYSGRDAFEVPDASYLRDYLRSAEPVVCVLAEAHLPLVSALDFHIVERVGTRLIISNVEAPSELAWTRSRAP
jgi:4-amino-4-deoxy-L-arabinose transferase-like glycosyltransferase